MKKGQRYHVALFNLREALNFGYPRGCFMPSFMRMSFVRFFVTRHLFSSRSPMRLTSLPQQVLPPQRLVHQVQFNQLALVNKVLARTVRVIFFYLCCAKV